MKQGESTVRTKTLILLAHPWPGFQVVTLAEHVAAIVIPGKPTRAYWADEAAFIIEPEDLPQPVDPLVAEPGAMTFRPSGMQWGVGMEIWTRDGKIAAGRDLREEILSGIRDIDMNGTPTMRAALMRTLSGEVTGPVV